MLWWTFCEFVRHYQALVMQRAPGPGSGVSPQQSSVQTQLSVWFARLPAVTAAVLAACSALLLLQLLLGLHAVAFVCLQPQRVVFSGQLWRLLTAPLVHAGPLHLVLNMSAWVPLGASLERQVGSVQFAHLALLFALLGGSLHAAAGASGGAAACAVGLSGVIFALLVVETHLSPAPTRSLLGLVHIQARYYPLALLLLLQLLLPDASFLGHLAGVLVGYAYAWGWLNWAVLPPAAVTALERRCTAAAARPNFIFAAGLPDPHGGGLPRWVTSAGAAEGGPAFRTPAWLTRAYAQAQAAAGLAAPPPAAQPEPFEGHGRALGGSGAGPARAGRGTEAAPVAVLSDEHREEARVRAARAAEARAGRIAPQALVGQAGGGGALGRLLEMGFAPEAARGALAASGGSVGGALELLGATR